MNSNKPKRLKVTSRRLEPLRALPKLKKLTEDQEVAVEKTEVTVQSVVQSQSIIPTLATKPTEKTTREADDAQIKGNTSAKSVEFVLQNHKHIICKELLKDGYLDAFHDFYSLLVADGDRLGAKMTTVEKGIADLRDSLVKAEDEVAKGNWLKVLTIYSDVAEKFLESKVGEAARYFYEKVTTLLHTLLLQSKIDSDVYFQRFINAKLGLVKCFDFDKESGSALLILEEIYAKTAKEDEFRDEIAQQLVTLYMKLGQVEENNRNLEAAIGVYRKCTAVCVESGLPKEEFMMVLRMGAAMKKSGHVNQAIELVNSHRLKNVKLPRELANRFEIFSFRLLAKCHEALGDFEEAENNYKNFYELLKMSEEHRESFGGKPSLKLGDICWRKENWKEGLKYYQEYFEEGLRAKTKIRETINHARVTLSVAKGFDEFESFLEYFQMSRNRVEDIVAFKSNRKLL